MLARSRGLTILVSLGVMIVGMLPLLIITLVTLFIEAEVEVDFTEEGLAILADLIQTLTLVVGVSEVDMLVEAIEVGEMGVGTLLTLVEVGVTMEANLT